jgi:TonB family protein
MGNNFYAASKRLGDLGGGNVINTKRATNEKLRRRLSGRLFRYTFAFSAALHLGVWAFVGWPKGVTDGEGIVAPQDKSAPIPIVLPYEKLPPPPSVEYVERPRMPVGAPSTGGVGEIPLPVPDRYAEANTIPDAVPGNNAPLVTNGQRIIVEDPGASEIKAASASPHYVEFVPTSKPPVLIYQSKPTYPDIARDSGVEGDVVLLVYIDERGIVRNAVVQSSPGLPALEEAAKKAAMKCKFKPAKQQGVPVGVWYSLVMEFRL